MSQHFDAHGMKLEAHMYINSPRQKIETARIQQLSSDVWTHETYTLQIQ